MAAPPATIRGMTLKNEVDELKKCNFIEKRALLFEKCDYIPARFENYDV